MRKNSEQKFELNHEALKLIRMSRGVTKSELSKALNVSKDFITKLEKGEAKIDYKRLVALSKFFNIDKEFFLYKINSKHCFFGLVLKGKTSFRMYDAIFNIIKSYEKSFTAYDITKKYFETLNIDVNEIRWIDFLSVYKIVRNVIKILYKNNIIQKTTDSNKRKKSYIFAYSKLMRND